MDMSKIRYFVNYVIFAITTFIIVLMGLYVSRETFNYPYQNNNNNSVIYNENNLYSNDFIIDNITENGNKNILYLRDCNGFIWKYETDIDDLYINDIVSCVMYNNETELIYDDEIINLNYSRCDLLINELMEIK